MANDALTETGKPSAAAGGRIRIESAGIAWSRRERARAAGLRWMGRLSGLAIVSIAAALVAALFPVSLLTLGLVALSGLAVAGASGAGLVAAFGGRRQEAAAAGTVEVRGDEIVVAAVGGRRIAAAEVAQGWLEDASPPGSAAADAVWRAVLRLRDGVEVAVGVADRAEGERLLRAVGVSVVDRVLRVPLRSVASLVRRGELLGAVGMLLGVASLPAALVSLVVSAGTWWAQGLGFGTEPAVYWARYTALTAVLSVAALLTIRALYRVMRRREAVVGTDGVAVESFGKRVFVPYDDVARVTRDPQGVRLVRRGGGSVLLPTLAEAGVPSPTVAGAGPNLDAMAADLPAARPSGEPRAAVYRRDVARRETLLDRIAHARSAAGAGEAGSATIAVLDRRGESAAAWRDRLRGLLAKGGEASPYREVAVESAELLRVVEDAGAPPERRIAAAVAVSGSHDEPARRRVRIAVDACADDDLRAALDAAAEGEIEEPLLQRVQARRR